MDRRRFLKLVFSGVFSLSFIPLANEAQAVPIIDIRSDKRKTLPGRKSNRFIILHTTEAVGRNVIMNLSRGGKTNYIVDMDGKIYRIVEKHQISIGCGRSIWNETLNLDNHAINIEVVGYHHTPPSPVQYGSLRYLLTTLKKTYKIRDENIMPHSQVAYGRPNKWHRRSHRGRKRCGMLFATDPVRKKIGLIGRAKSDPDVQSGRLIVADPSLEEILYSKPGRVAAYGPAAKTVLPMSDVHDEDMDLMTVEEGQTAWAYAGDEYADKSTIYIFLDGRIKRGDDLLHGGFDFRSIQTGTRIAVGYVYGGIVTKERTPYKIIGNKWNMSNTLYITGSKITTGAEINDALIPAGTIILFRS